MAEIVSYKIGSFGHKGVGKSTYLTSLFIILSQSRYEGVNDVKRDYLSQARGIGCDVDKLVWVKQDKQQ